MQRMNKSASKRATRSDTGKPHKAQFTPEYYAYLAREHGCRRSAKLSEAEVMALIAEGCYGCGSTAELIYQSRYPYCFVCDRTVRYLGGDGQFQSWLARAARHRA